MNRGHSLSRFVRAGAVILGLTSVSAPHTPAVAAEAYSEEAVKAAYLYRFAGYVIWPEDPPADKPFTIDVLGAPGVARELRRLLPNRVIHNHIVEVHEISGAGDWGTPQIIYVSAGHANVFREFAPGHPSVLMVTDEEGGLNAGSTLNFLQIDRNVRFEVSLTAAERSGLKVSSDLLGVAVRVKGNRSRTSLDCSQSSVPGPPRETCAGLMAGPSRDSKERMNR